MNDADFRNRVKVACLSYASYIQSEPPDTAAHNTRIKWAQQCVLQPDFTAGQVAPPAVMDPQVQTDGPDISDVALQEAVETTVNKLI
jgi:hypothetical protein